jgi:hypothetical protein
MYHHGAGTGAPLLGCRQFESPACDPADDAPDKWAPLPGKVTQAIQGKCSGDFIAGSIVDHVAIPPEIKPGDYVLSFRWDCEETAEVFASCADVAISPPLHLPPS